MALGDVKKIYQEVIHDVCTTVREALSEEGYDDHTLQELRTLWLNRLENSKAVEPLPAMSAVDEATTRLHRQSRTTTNPTTNVSSSAMGIKQQATTIDSHNPTIVRSSGIHQASAAAVSQLQATGLSNFSIQPYGTTMLNSGTGAQLSMGNTGITRTPIYSKPQNRSNVGNSNSTTTKTSTQIDGSNDEPNEVSNNSSQSRKRKSKIVQISFQLDGTGPPVTDDEDDDDDNEVEANEPGDDLDDDDDDDANDEGAEDPNPLCSDDDVSDDEPAELFDADNVVVCQYDKISRIKNKWRFTLKSGVMNIHGRDYVFNKATGEADW
jgi:transcription initiation factor TFIIA large subunit